MKCLHVLWSMALLSLLLLSCNTKKNLNVAPEKTAKEAKVPTLAWDTKMVELGKINKGDIREFEYTFTNVSKVPVQLEIVTTCHCTTLDFPASTKVFHKGDSGTIKATFDSSEKEESEKIDITVILANTDAQGYPIIEEVFFSYQF